MSRARAIRGALILAVLSAIPAAAGARTTSPPAPMDHLGGWIAVSDSLAGRWPVANAFRFPVGDRDDFSRPASPGESGYALLRGVISRSDSTAPHQGVDLGNGAGGGMVRAAAAGLVVRGRGDDWQVGYGYYVTLAHRLRNGSLVYTVYAHLATGSVRPRAGSCVESGDTLGCVGRTGRASTAHLHFEVRRPSDPAERWEKAATLDPIAFVRNHPGPVRRHEGEAAARLEATGSEGSPPSRRPRTQTKPR